MIRKMNFTRVTVSAAWFAAATLAFGQAVRDTASPIGTPQGQKMPDVASPIGAGQPTAAQRASTLVGMPVRNPQGQDLGVVKDVVLNLNNGNIAYAVLAVSGGMFGSSEKLVAVPMNAFTTTGTAGNSASFLTLNSTLANLQQARGLTPNNWPSANSTMWGAQPFFQQTPNQNNRNLAPGQIPSPGQNPFPGQVQPPGQNPFPGQIPTPGASPAPGASPPPGQFPGRANPGNAGNSGTTGSGSTGTGATGTGSGSGGASSAGGAGSGGGGGR